MRFSSFDSTEYFQNSQQKQFAFRTRKDKKRLLKSLQVNIVKKAKIF